MKPYAFFLDIDGTLLAKNGGVPEENIAAIKKAQAEGHFVLLNTGRSYYTITEPILNCAPFDGFVSGLGADIRIHGKQILMKTIPFETSCRLLELFFTMPEEILYLRGAEINISTNEARSRGRFVAVRSVDEFREKYRDAVLNKITCSYVKDRSVFEPFLNDFTMYYHPTYYEGALKGCNKAIGMEIAAKELGVPMERCVAIGDSANDAEMLTAAGIAVVMGNYDAGTEKYADFITDTVDNAGVAKAILKLIEEK